MSIQFQPHKRRFLSRRQFTRLMLTGAIGGSVAIAELASRPLGLVKWFSVNFRRISLGFGQSSEVAIITAPSYDSVGEVLNQLRTAWDSLSMPEVLGKRVVLKPNIIYNIPGRVINTHPVVIDAAIQLMREKGAKEIVVAEGTAYQRDITDLLYQSGIQEVLERNAVPFVDLNHDDIKKVRNKGGYSGREDLWVPMTVANADLLISMPKLKTHHWAGATLSMKNLYGIVPGLKYGWPKNALHVTGIEANIVELYETLAPQVAIVDGIIGMEEDGPLFGRSKSTQVLVVGRDLVAVDATCARIMGFEPSSEVIKHIWYADWLGQGVLNQSKIIIKGVPLESVRQNYLPPPSLDDNIKRY
ncbi:MAG: DUF362 domain-containing protein [Chloroflexota bacterium]